MIDKLGVEKGLFQMKIFFWYYFFEQISQIRVFLLLFFGFRHDLKTETTIYKGFLFFSLRLH